MVSESNRSLPIRIRDVLCFFFLILAALCEAYTVAAIALDRFVPPWYRTLGWSLFTLPIALAVGLLLLYGDRRRYGFYISAMSLSLYAVLVCFDAHRGPAEQSDWIFEGVYITFCAIGVVAAKVLMNRPMLANPTDAPNHVNPN